MDAPFLVRRDEVQRDLLVTVWLVALDERCLEIDRRLVNNKPLSECAHPVMVLVELLASRQGPPRDQFVDVRIAGIIADMFALDA